MHDPTKVKLPESTHARIRLLLLRVQEAQGNVNLYFQAVCDSLALAGDWRLEPSEMMAVKPSIADGSVTNKEEYHDD